MSIPSGSIHTLAERDEQRVAHVDTRLRGYDKRTDELDARLHEHDRRRGDKRTGVSASLLIGRLSNWPFAPGSDPYRVPSFPGSADLPARALKIGAN